VSVHPITDAGAARFPAVDTIEPEDIIGVDMVTPVVPLDRVGAPEDITDVGPATGFGEPAATRSARCSACMRT
jgi:hypothetical protein